MNHLTPSEIIDLVEGTLDVSRAAHADRCGRCREAAADVRLMLEITAPQADPGENDVPEPSPLFWDQLSARVRSAVSQEPAPPREWMMWRPAFAAVAGVLVLVTAVGTLMLRGAADRPGVPPTPASAVAVNATIEARSDVTLDTNPEVWEVLTAAAADLELDAARDAGMSVQPAAIDGAVHRLNTDELNELGRLLQSEMKRAGN